MKNVLKIISLIGLLLTVVPSFLVFYDIIVKSTHFILMGIGTLLWFISAPLWMKGTSLEEK
jgi:hypothetical protein